MYIEIKPIIKESISVISNIRREEVHVVLTRLRIGHTRITHSWLLNRDEQPNYTGYDVPFTLKHFLLDCFDFQQARRSFFQVHNVRDLFKDIPIENIAFLKENFLTKYESFNNQFIILLNLLIFTSDMLVICPYFLP